MGFNFNDAYGSAYSGAEALGYQNPLAVYHNYYGYRRLITIPPYTVPSDLTNFVVLVQASLDLPARNSGGFIGGAFGSAYGSAYGAGYNLDLATGFDITFEDDQHNTLAFEIEDLDLDNTGMLNAWVKLPTVYARRATRFFVYYGNPNITSFGGSNPWGSFENVYHLGESANGTANEYEDSAKANDGTGGGGDPTSTPVQVTGQIEEGQSFNTRSWITTAQDTITTTSPLSASAWVNPSTFAGPRVYYSRGYTYTTTSGWNFLIGQSAGGRAWASVQTLEAGILTTHDLYGSTHLTVGTWYHIAATWLPGVGLSLYVNGVRDAHSSIADTTLVNQYLGNQIGRKDASFDMGGVLDEVHSTGTALSAAWINAEYLNQFAPASFYVLGIEQPALGYYGNVISVPAFNYAAMGSLALSGVAKSVPAFHYVTSGGLTFSGTSLGQQHYTFTASGSLTLSGHATSVPAFKQTGRGSLVLGGSAGRVLAARVTGSGGLTLSGKAGVYPALRMQASGGLTLGGHAISKPNYQRITSGGLVLGGSATVSQQYANVGGFLLAGHATSVPAFQCKASGGLVLSGSASKASHYTYQAQGGLTLTGSARTSYTGKGGLTLSGSAIKVPHYHYTPMGGLTLSGTSTKRPNYEFVGGQCTGIVPSVVRPITGLAHGGTYMSPLNLFGPPTPLHFRARVCMTGFVLGGSFRTSYTGKGGLIIGGQAIAKPHFSYTGKGGLLITSPPSPALTGTVSNVPLLTCIITIEPVVTSLATCCGTLSNQPKLTGSITIEPLLSGNITLEPVLSGVLLNT